MLNTSLLRTVLILLSVSKIIFSIPVPDESSDELPSIPTSFQREDYSDEIISTSTITHMSPVPEDFTTEFENVCETSGQSEECDTFLATHLGKDSELYKSLQNIKYTSKLLKRISVPPLPTLDAFNRYYKIRRNGLPINAKYTSLEETVLHVAAKEGEDYLITLLLERGADVQAKNKDGDTPLHTAISNCRTTTVKKLLDAGADVNVTNNKGETPLFKAVYYLSPLELFPPSFIFDFILEYENVTFVNGKNIIKLLLEHGADTNIADNLGKTPLHIAAKNGSLASVKLLIEGGANINATDVNNQTPLHVATESNYVSVVEYLVSAGCDKTITDSDNKTALDIAKEKEFTEIVDFLCKENY